MPAITNTGTTTSHGMSMASGASWPKPTRITSDVAKAHMPNKAKMRMLNPRTLEAASRTASPALRSSQ